MNYLIPVCNLFSIFSVILGTTTSASYWKQDDSTSSRCAESCLINPYNTDTSNKSTTPVRHCARLTSDNKCECDWQKVLTPQGTCECRNPRHKIDPVTNDCICDLDQCNTMDHCTGIITKDPYGCCERHCEECPEDSYPGSDNKCQCYPCKPKVCKDNQTVSVLRKGTLIPGNYYLIVY